MTNKLFASIAVAALAAVVPAAADCPLADPADCVYVDDDCVTIPGAGTDADPYCTIQDAINSVLATTSPASPATILVRGGSYTECVDGSSTFDPDPALNDDRPVQLVADEWLIAGSPNPDHADPSAFESVAQMTVISGAVLCDGTMGIRLPAVSLAGTGASIRGFAITKGGLSGVEARGSVTISNNLLFENEGVLGGGVQLTTTVCTFGDVAAAISHNVIRNNLADDTDEFGAGDGGGIFVASDGANLDFGCTGGRSDVDVSDNLVRTNTAQNLIIDFLNNDTFAGGGGISVETFTEFPLDDDPTTTGTRIVVARNTVEQNVVVPGADGSGFGGGLFASTLGFGEEVLVIEDNTLGPSNIGSSSNGGSFGGGVSVSATPVLFGLHDVEVRNNTIDQNQADIGGGLDVLAVAQDMDLLQRLRVTIRGNSVNGNASVDEAGGVNLEYNSARSLDLEDQANLFPGATVVADELTFLFSGNTVTGNTSGTAGAGAVLRPAADADPDSLEPPFFPCSPGAQRPTVATIDAANNFFEGNVAQDTSLFGGKTGCSDPVCEAVICSFDSFCCDTFWDQICADEAAADPSCNCGTSDCCVSSLSEVIGAGVVAIPSARGESLASVNVITSTLVNNTIDLDIGDDSVGFVGGIEVASTTVDDCFGNFRGSAVVNIERCIVSENHADGIGGPPFDPVVTDQTVTVIKSSVFGNGDSDPDNDPDLDYEDTLFPDGPPDGNILDDPLLDSCQAPVECSWVPDLCSPVFDIGSCSLDPGIVCLDDADCGADVCVAEGAGYLASPDINADDALDGVDVMRFSTAFGAEIDVDPRYNPDADIDRNGMVDGLDLPFIAPLFGQECTP